MFIVQKQETTNKTLRMPDDLIEQLEEIATLEKISFNQLVVQCCEYAINHLPRSSTMKITSVEDFRQRKKQYKAAFMKYMEHSNPKATPQSLSQIFTDAIFTSQPRNAALNIDFLSLLKGDITTEEYQQTLEQYFIKTDKKDPKGLAKGYVVNFKIVRDFLKQAEYI